MNDTMSWSFFFPAFVILCLIAVIAWMIDARRVDNLRLRMERDEARIGLRDAKSMEETAYWSGMLKALQFALSVVEGEKVNK